MSDIKIEEIITNLEILSNVEKNKKIITKESYLNIEKTSMFECVKRWYNGESREVTINSIDLLINNSILALSTEVNNELLILLEKVIDGINNLKTTYSDCAQTQARLNTIIVKIQNELDKYKDKNILDKNV